MSFGVDIAWGKPSVKALKAAGVQFVIRYLSYDPSKNLNSADVAAYRAAGIEIVSIWETQADRCLSGRAGGRADAKTALAQANTLGIPAGRPIFFAPADLSSLTSAYGPADAYMTGCTDVLGYAGVGGYFGYDLMRYMLDRRRFKYGFQTYAWSGGRRDQRCQLFQFSNGHTIEGVSVDFDRTYADDYGQWGFHPPHGASGHFNFEGSLSLPDGHWLYRGTPSKDVHFGTGPQDKWAVVKHRVCVEGPHKGQHQAIPMPWNS